MSTHNMFLWENKKNISTFKLKKKCPISRPMPLELMILYVVWVLSSVPNSSTNSQRRTYDNTAQI